MPAYGGFNSSGPRSSPPDRLRDHSPQKSSPLRHTVSTRSNNSDTGASVFTPSRQSIVGAVTGHGAVSESYGGYDSPGDPFVTRKASTTSGGTKRERSESPVKKNAAFAKWERREQEAGLVEQPETWGGGYSAPTLLRYAGTGSPQTSPRASPKREQTMDISPKKIKDDDWRTALGTSKSSVGNTLGKDRPRAALRPVAGNVMQGREEPLRNGSENDGSFNARSERVGTVLVPPPPKPNLHSRGLSVDSALTPSPEQPHHISAPTKNSLATLSRSDSMRASTRPSRPQGHVRFGSTEAAAPRLDGEDLMKLQKSSTPHFRHLGKMASDGGGEDFTIHSPEEQVAGLFGRRKLQKSGSLKPNAKQGSSFSSQYASTRWMDTQRKHLQAYEYLCHIGEAKDWLQGVLEPMELPPIVQLEEALRNGVTLAEVVVKLGSSLPEDQRRALGSQRIFRNPRLQFRHSDNIALFFRFLAQIELPELFRFELVDLYEKKNIPKVIYCIHALSWLLFRKGVVEFRIGNLVGQLQFEEHELEEAQKGIERSGVQMPNFGGMREALQVEEPEPEPTPEELLAGQTEMIVDFQSQVRGALVRLKLGGLMQDLWDAEDSIAQLQALARGGFGREVFEFRFAVDASTRAFQTAAKAFVVRRQLQQKRHLWQDNLEIIVKMQSVWRGKQARLEGRQIRSHLQRNKHGIQDLQAAMRGALGRWRAGDLWHETRDAAAYVDALQACARGALERMRISDLMSQLRDVGDGIVLLQSTIRGWNQRCTMRQQAAATKQAVVGVVRLQAAVRGLIHRRTQTAKHETFTSQQQAVIGLQSAARARLARQQQTKITRALQSSTDVIKSVQAAVRGQQTRNWVTSIRHQLHEHQRSTEAIQSLARGVLTRRGLGTQLAALEQKENDILALQAMARAYIERQRIYEQLMSMEQTEGGIVKLQAFCRSMLERSRIGTLLAELEEREHTVLSMQAASRGFVVRSKFEAKKRHFNENMQKVIKLQSYVRAKQQGESYKSLVNGKNPPLPVVRRHLHLLTDSSLEFEGELEAERLRRQVVESVRRNELVEGYVEGLDVKIALLVKNKITLDEVVKHQKHFGGSASQLLRNRNTTGHNAGGFDLKALNKSSRKKLAGYEELFFTLQTQPIYLARLFQQLVARPLAEKESKDYERLMLTLFGYAQKSREEYFLLKVLGAGTSQTINQSRDLEETQRLLAGSFLQKLILSYVRSPRDRAWLKNLFGGLVKEGICARDDLDLESDPLLIYRAVIHNRGLATGHVEERPRDLPREMVIREPDVRQKYVEHLQELRDLCDAYFLSLEETLVKMPYGVRHMASEQYHALCERFPRQDPAQLAMITGIWLWKTFLLPAIREPETWGVVDRGLNALHKRNLSQVIVVLGQVASGRLFGAENMYLQPLNSWISESLERWQECLSQMFETKTLEEWFDADQFSDLYSKTKPTVYIKLGDLFAMHALVADNIGTVAPTREDPIKELLVDLGTAKSNESDLSGAANGSEITLTLRSRYTLQEDPSAESRQLFTATKRLVLYIIKVQSGSNLMEILLRPITHEDADRWFQLVQEELAEEDADRRRNRPQHSRASTFDPHGSLRGARTQSVYSEAPSAFSEDRRDLLDLQGMTYAEVKSSALENILALEQPSVPPQFRVSRHNNYQELLNSIACDIRQKHRRRLDRQREVESTRATLTQLDQKASYLDDQLKYYNSYIEQCLRTLASKKGTKHKFTLPFTKQWSHERELERNGRQPQFGSYKYSARQLADKGVLMSWPAFAPEHWNQLNMVISSDEVGVFHLEASSGSLMVPGASANLLLDDLLQAQYDNKASIVVFEEVGGASSGENGARLAVNLLLHLVFKKFYRDE